MQSVFTSDWSLKAERLCFDSLSKILNAGFLLKNRHMTRVIWCKCQASPKSFWVKVKSRTTCQVKSLVSILSVKEIRHDNRTCLIMILLDDLTCSRVKVTMTWVCTIVVSQWNKCMHIFIESVFTSWFFVSVQSYSLTMEGHSSPKSTTSKSKYSLKSFIFCKIKLKVIKTVTHSLSHNLCLYIGILF